VESASSSTEKVVVQRSPLSELLNVTTANKPKVKVTTGKAHVLTNAECLKALQDKENEKFHKSEEKEQRKLERMQKKKQREDKIKKKQEERARKKEEMACKKDERIRKRGRSNLEKNQAVAKHVHPESLIPTTEIETSSHGNTGPGSSTRATESANN